MKKAICVICERKLKPSPTKLWWYELSFGKGICYECILRLATAVLQSLESYVDGG